MNNFFYKSTISFPPPESNYIFKKLDELFFRETGLSLFYYFNRHIEDISNHFRYGVENYLLNQASQPYDNYYQKSLAVLQHIREMIAKSNLKKASILFSGGKDSTILARLLVESKVNLTGYFSMPVKKNSQKNGLIIRKIENIATSIGMNELEVCYSEINPIDLLAQYRNEPLVNRPAIALASIFKNTSISNQDNVWFAQNCDTLSNNVHTQLKYFDNNENISLRQMQIMIIRMTCMTFPTYFRYIAFAASMRIIDKIRECLIDLQGISIQNFSRLIGTYLVHTPMDSNFIYKISSINSIKVYNPFHSSEMQRIYMTYVLPGSQKRSPNKYEIDSIIRILGLDKIEYLRGSFGVGFENHNTKVQYFKNIYNLSQHK